MKRPVERTAAEAEPVHVPLDGVALEGDLALPERAKGLVLFAHGSGSSRFSPRNRAVAADLQAAGFGTLLLDLLTEHEEKVDELTGRLRFDIRLLAARLEVATDWATQRSPASHLPVGYFGASTGAAAALMAAARRRDVVRAVVSRGGRPDLAGSAALREVSAPTLLVVGGADEPVIELNREAMAWMCCTRHLEIVPGATHLFPEPGALERVSELAREWFDRYLAPQSPDAPVPHSNAW